MWPHSTPVIFSNHVVRAATGVILDKPDDEPRKGVRFESFW